MQLSFRYKLGFLFAVLSLVIAGGSTYILYQQAYALVLNQLGSRLRDVGSVGTFLFGHEERQYIEHLTTVMRNKALPLKPSQLTELPEGETLSSLTPEIEQQLMATPEFQRLVQRLRQIKQASRLSNLPYSDSLSEAPDDLAANPFRITYAYLGVPLPQDPTDKLLAFLADADYKGENTPIGTIYRENSIDPVLTPTLRNGQATIAQVFVTDKWTTFLGVGIPIKNASGATIAVLGLDLDVRNETNLLNQLQWLSLIIVGIAIILSLLLSHVIAWHLSLPIQALRDGAERVRNGDLSTQVILQNKDELGILADTFNVMVTRIREHTEHLEQKVASRTQELSQTLHQLKTSQTQLVQSEKMAMLGQMVAGLAHEINTPLGYVKNNLLMTRDALDQFNNLVLAGQRLEQIIKNKDVTEEQMQTALNEVSTLAQDLIEQQLPGNVCQLAEDSLFGVTQISELVVSLRNFARLDQAPVKAVNIHECIDSALKIGHHRMKGRVEIYKHYGQLPTIECSPARINQVILNLLNNATDAISEHGIITLTTTADDRYIHLSIKDNGKGIAAEHLNKIFEPFFTTKGAGEGTGLGLAICSQIIEQHQGYIKVDSTIEVGTCIQLSLPIYHTTTQLTIEDKQS